MMPSTGAPGTEESNRSLATARRFAKVPAITAMFWLTKALTTAFGESTSDYSVHAIAPVVAVLLGFVAFCVSMAIQFRTSRYSAWAYWFAVSMVGVFGTMAADVLHVALGVPYAASTPLFAIALAAIFFAWHRTERTLSIHSVNTPRREIFYWLAVVATFALGTAAGDLTAYTVGLGYLSSVFLFGGLILVPALGYRFFHWNSVASFWAAYVLTRPLGASFADWLGKPKSLGGVGVGAGTIAVILGVAIVCCVVYLARTGESADAAPPANAARHAA
jgi:uncharacterized membrane-anchored protein